jgi:hypothetical protein
MTARQVQALDVTVAAGACLYLVAVFAMIALVLSSVVNP